MAKQANISTQTIASKGTVTQVIGDVKVLTAAGQTHTLQVGDKVNIGDTIQTGATGAVALMIDGANAISLGHSDSLSITSELLASLYQPAINAANDAAKIQALIEQGADPTQVAAATAAGGAGGENAGHSFVVIEGPNSRVTIPTGFPTEGILLDGKNTYVDPIIGNRAPQARDDTSQSLNGSNAADDGLTVPEDSVLQIPSSRLLQNDIDPDGDTLTIISVQNAVNGTVALVNGNVVFTPNPNYNGPASFTYTVSDGRGGTATATVNIGVTPVNDAPKANNDNSTGAADDALTTPEDKPLTINPALLLANDSDPDGDTLTIISVQNAVNGTVALVNGNVVFTPNPNYNGPASFTYTVSDGRGGTATATVNIGVTPVNDAPKANNDNSTGAADDALTTPEDKPLTINPALLLANDSDPDGDTLTIISVQNAVNGTVALVNGNVVFTPNPNYNGPASFTYTVSDGRGGTATATVNIGVTPVNDAPKANNDNSTGAADDALTTPEDKPLTINPALLLANDSDPDGDTLTIISVQNAVNGTVALVNGNVVFTPNPNYNGPASFTYTVSDGRGGTATATVNIGVTPVNDPPKANNDNSTGAADDALTTPEDKPLTINPALLLANDSDPDGDTLTIISVQNAVNGTVALVNGNVVFTPNPNYNGPASFTYTVSDGRGGTATATVNIGVTPVNDPPIAENDRHTGLEGDPLSTHEDEALSINPAILLANDHDLDGDTLSLVSVQNASHGAVSIINGQVVFTPAADFNGIASFSYTISDGHGGTSTATVTINVIPENDDPLPNNDNSTGAADDALTTPEDKPLTINPALLLANDSDIDGDTLTILSVQNAINGSVALINGNVIFTPNPNYNGPASFTYTVSDGFGGTATATVNIGVTPVNDAPKANNDNSTGAAGDALTTPEDKPLTINPALLLANDSDPDGDTLTIISVQNAMHGTVAIVDGKVVFTPAADYHGPASFTYTVSDGHGGTATATVNIGVTPVNDAPKANNDNSTGATGDALTTPEDKPLTINPALLLANDSDPDGDTLTIISVQNAEHGTVAIVDGKVVFTPAADYHGPASFTYTVSDGHGGTATATVNIGVTPVNDPPIAENDRHTGLEGDPLSTHEDEALSINPAILLANDHDLDGDTLSLVSVQNASHGAVSIINGQVIFTPAADFNGIASFSYTISDGHGGTSTATVTINVIPENDDPLPNNDNSTGAADDALTTPEDKPLTINPALLLANDSDIDGDILTITSVQNAEHGTVAMVDGKIVFTPAADYHGPASFTYTVSDGFGGTATATVNIGVTPVNDAPVIFDTHNWMSSNPTQAPAASAPYYALLVDIPSDVDSTDNLTVTAANVPTGVYYFNGSTSIAVSAGMTLYDAASNINLLDNLFYKPTAPINDIQNLALTLNVSDDGGIHQWTQSVFMHEVFQTATPGPQGAISSGKAPLTSGHNAEASSVLSAGFVKSINADPGAGQLILKTNFQSWNHKVSNPVVDGGFQINSGDRNGNALEAQVNIYIFVDGIKFQAVSTADANPNTWTYDGTPPSGSGLMKTTIDFDAVVNTSNPSQSLASYLQGHPSSIGETWTIQYDDTQGGNEQARYVSFEYQVFDPGNPAIAVNGSELADQIYGTSGNENILYGNGGDDEIFGQAGNDNLNGGAGNDTLTGGRGNDILNGGVGHDILNGGNGSDLFVLGNLAANSDTIQDFKVAAPDNNNTSNSGDILDITDLLSGASAAAGVFVAGNAVAAGAFLQFESDGLGNTKVWFDADGSGVGNPAVQVATLMGVAVDPSTLLNTLLNNGEIQTHH
ncbi:retention module-containing protein [Deefgea piscis]|uniref:Retention module-containing protein n=1 Tax=Deefgea piscis TaxID=2739061 RepID=A0A6M8SPM5_9NEIS|nr:retention module-containing protein [Deefgea piscis]QKJ66661.1 retention module-containing protein [Deefgea piscis]